MQNKEKRIMEKNNTKTQIQIKERINEIGDEIRNLYRAHYQDKEYLKLVRKAEKIKKRIQNKNESEIEKLHKERNKLKEELKNKKLSKRLQLSDYLLNWIKQYMIGVNWGYKDPYISWHSNDERFVILTNPGETAGQGTAMGTMGYYYAPTDHTVIDTKTPSNGLHSNKLGYEIGARIEGRLTKENKKLLLEQLEKYKKENNIK